MSRARFTFLLVTLSLVACEDGPYFAPPETGPVDLTLTWETAAARSVDMDPARLEAAREAAGRIGRMRSLLVVRHGRLVLEEYYGPATADSLADVRSVTKSIVGTLTGLAIAAGHIEGVDQPITDFLTAPTYPVTAAHDGITVRHLLTMGGGFDWMENANNGYNDWLFADDHVAYLLEQPVSDVPGTAFSYNSAAVHLLGLVIEEATGMPLASWAAQTLFGPLGIGEVVWEPLLDGQVNGGAGIDLRPRDLARFGLLFAQDGRSGDRQILPAGWVAAATTAHWPRLGSASTIGDLSYGYLWWTDRTDGAFFAWGYGGQFVYVDPALELVAVATTDWVGVSQDIGANTLQRQVLDIVLERVVPAVLR